MELAIFRLVRARDRGSPESRSEIAFEPSHFTGNPLADFYHEMTLDYANIEV
jgi:hypothetical protein